MLAEHEDKSSPHFVYDRGELAITVLSYEHAELNRLRNDFLGVIAMAWPIAYCNASSITCKREAVERGFEPDACGYVQRAGQMAGQKRFALTSDPPPDRVLEIALTHSSLAKLPICATVGVPAVWRYDGERVRRRAVAGARYVECERRLAFPALQRAPLAALRAASQQMPRTAWLRHVRGHRRSTEPMLGGRRQ